MNKLPNHTALKEWSNVVDALGAGEQVILIRKGGIADPDFGLEAQRFYLYPTFFHQGEHEPRTSVSITAWCEVVRSWTISALEVLELLEPMVALPKETLLSRYRFRPDQALRVIGVRTWTLAERRVITFRAEYGGCLSWISIDEEISIDGSRPALAEDVLQEKLSAIDRLLAAP